jgi:IS5 family transposase
MYNAAIKKSCGGKMQRSFFEVQASYNRLDKAGDPLVKLNGMVKWSELDNLLDPIRYTTGEKGGRPGTNPLVVVKFLLLQSLYNLSDDACEYMVNDRLSFKRFLGLSISEKAPDARTIWLYRERIKHKKLHDKIFAWFVEQIDKAGYRAQEGQIVDASFIPTHKPTGKHKKQFAEEIPLTQEQASQIDPEATFTKKGKETHHGYKNHIQIDKKYKIIRRAKVTTASRHDSQEFANLVDSGSNDDANVWADSAYRSEENEKMLKEKNLVSQVHERAYRNLPLSPDQKAGNKVKSSSRVRVEHIFGHMATSMGGVLMHVIGLARVEVKVMMKNLAYNMQRFVYLATQKKVIIV